jgi:hypothetical protein
MSPSYGRSPWLDDEVHEATGRLTVILGICAKDALIVLRDLARDAGVSLTNAAKTLNDGGLEALRGLAESPTREPDQVDGPPSEGDATGPHDGRQ